MTLAELNGWAGGGDTAAADHYMLEAFRRAYERACGELLRARISHQQLQRAHTDLVAERDRLRQDLAALRGSGSSGSVNMWDRGVSHDDALNTALNAGGNRYVAADTAADTPPNAEWPTDGYREPAAAGAES